MRTFIIMYGTFLLLALFAACEDEYEDEEGVLDCVDELSDGDSSQPPSPLYTALQKQLCKGADKKITIDQLATVTHLDASRYSGQVEDEHLWVLEHCVNIKVLVMHHGGITDVSPLVGLPRLESLDISFNRIADISPLVGLARLKSLDIFSNRITDISPLKDLPNLTKLRFSGPNFDQLVDMVNLQDLDLLGTKIVDIRMLAELKNLQWLNLNFNKITDINVLSGLVQLEELSIIQNWIVDLKPLVDNPGLGQGDLVIVGTNPLSEASLNEHIPALEARGVVVKW